MDMATAREKFVKFELTPDDFKYTKLRVPYNDAEEHEMIIEESFYFFPIQKSRLDENEKLQQNNNWGGTFNPTME